MRRESWGKAPKGRPFSAAGVPPPEPEEEEDDDWLLPKLLEEQKIIADSFLSHKVPIIWVYGQPIRSLEEVRRNYCFSLAKTHGFTYLSLDDEIALLAAKGSRAIQGFNL